MKITLLRLNIKPSDEVIIQWRAFNDLFTGSIGTAFTSSFGVDEETFCLPKMLEGGTWKAGRLLQRKRDLELLVHQLKLYLTGHYSKN